MNEWVASEMQAVHANAVIHLLYARAAEEAVLFNAANCGIRANCLLMCAHTWSEQRVHTRAEADD
jgi:hypothetical protein